jgi:hypothetical protein
MSGIQQAFYEGPLEARQPDEIASLYSAGPSMPPAISLFSPGKPTPVSPDELDRIRTAWRQSAEQSDVIIVVGARPVLADDHVWDPILASGADVWHIGGTSGTDFEQFRAQLGRRYTKLACTFSDGLSPLDVRLKIIG